MAAERQAGQPMADTCDDWSCCASTNGNKEAITTFFVRVGQWLSRLMANAEQWTSTQRWEAMIKAIFAGPLGVVATPTG